MDRGIEPAVNNRTRNLLIWSQTRYHCATDPVINLANHNHICSFCAFKKGLSPSVHELETATTMSRTWDMLTESLH